MNTKIPAENKEEIIIQWYSIESELCNCFGAKILLDALNTIILLPSSRER